MNVTSFNLEPFVQVKGHDTAAFRGWTDVGRVVACEAQSRSIAPVVVVDCYTGVFEQEIGEALQAALEPVLVVSSAKTLRSPAEIDALVQPDVTDDPVFGRITRLTLDDFFDVRRRNDARVSIEQALSERRGPILVIGTGAAMLADPDILIYADMPRWEHQLRFRRGEVANLGAQNQGADPAIQYKRSFFVDWRVCDTYKIEQMPAWDFVLDTTKPGDPRLVTGAAYRDALVQVVRQPFSLVPFFDPGPWGGQWMRAVCGLDENGVIEEDRPPNYAWCFNCVPEENSLLLRFGDILFETPSLNLVLDQPDALLGPRVRSRFGSEFPIRFDFLDTIEGGNLSLQVHPLTAYIREHFGLDYTQDESYYLMDASDDAVVYLGLKTGYDRNAFIRDLRVAQESDVPFPAEDYINIWPARKHDHFSIPAGTIHCSGRNCMVLEISATPYIFTFKLWDWGRLGLNGRPRPVHMEHGIANIQWNRDTDWVRDHLINKVETLRQVPGCREERTGLHELQFIETRRHWFTGPVAHDTEGSVDVLCLIDGAAVVVESPTDAFRPFRVNYAEVFVVPAQVGPYTIRPLNPSDQPMATIKARVRNT